MIIHRVSGIWYAAALQRWRAGRQTVGYYNGRRIPVVVLCDLEAHVEGRHWYTCAPVVMTEGVEIADSVVHGMSRCEP